MALPWWGGWRGGGETPRGVQVGSIQTSTGAGGIAGAGCWGTSQEEPWGTLQRWGSNLFWDLSSPCSSPAEHRIWGFREKLVVVSK